MDFRDIDLENKIFNLRTSDFESVALNVFSFQYNHNLIYRNFCQLVKQTAPERLSEIPCMPISFFKHEKVVTHNYRPELTFKSSGTTKSGRSSHYVLSKEMYEHSFFTTYEQNFGSLENQVVLALLPNYIEQGDSSLVYMVDYLIRSSNDPQSGFYLKNQQDLIDTIYKLKKNSTKKVVLFGVSYALLDLAEKNIDLSGVTVIETGGMKGRRKELVKEELHELLKNGLNLSHVNSEYGMTELLSQAYLDKDLNFKAPNWMKIQIRDVNDPFSILSDGHTGGVNIIDLANLYSCSFIASDDLGKKEADFFKILGRFDNSDIRGCNLLVN